MLTDAEKTNLIKIAQIARGWAYTPYSKYKVGAAVITKSGRIYDGGNIENAAYPVTMCAERVAIFKAVSQGELEIDAIAVVTENGGYPCGSCRQVMAEFGLDIQVFVADSEGNLVAETTVLELLPGAFTSKFLPENGE